MFRWLFHILIFATNSGKYQNKEKSLKRLRRLGLTPGMDGGSRKFRQGCMLVKGPENVFHIEPCEPPASVR